MFGLSYSAVSANIRTQLVESNGQRTVLWRRANCILNRCGFQSYILTELKALLALFSYVRVCMSFPEPRSSILSHWMYVCIVLLSSFTRVVWLKSVSLACLETVIDRHRVCDTWPIVRSIQSFVTVLINAGTARGVDLYCSRNHYEKQPREERRTCFGTNDRCLISNVNDAFHYDNTMLTIA